MSKFSVGNKNNSLRANFSGTGWRDVEYSQVKNKEQYDKNYSAIDWNASKKKLDSFKCELCKDLGKIFKVDDLGGKVEIKCECQNNPLHYEEPPLP